MEEEQVDKTLGGLIPPDLAEKVNIDVDKLNEGIQKEEVTATEEEVETTENTRESTTEKTKTATETTEEVEDPLYEGDNPFIQIEEGEVNKAPTSFEKIEDVYGSLKELGFEGEDLSVFNNVIDSIKGKDQELNTIKEEVTNLKGYEELLVSMPDDLYNLVNAYSRGEDYKSLMQTTVGRTLDFSLDADKHSDESLLKHYHPGVLSADEDYQDVKDTPAMKALVSQAKAQYSADKAALNKKDGELQTRISTNQKQFAESASNSIAELKKANPRVTANDINTLANVMGQGANGILGMFMDENGMFKPEAAESLLKIQRYEDTINAYKGMIKKQQSTIESMLSRATEKKREVGAADSLTEEEQIKRHVSEVIPDSNKNMIWK